MNSRILGAIAVVALLALFYRVTLGLLIFIGLLLFVIFELWQELLRAESSTKSLSNQVRDTQRKETSTKAELASIATIQKEANALITQLKADHKKEKESLLEKIATLERKKDSGASSQAGKELSQQLATALENINQLKKQRAEEQEKSKEKLLSLEQQLREALAKDDAHKEELERVLVLAIQEKKAVSEAKDDLIDKQYQALEALAKEKDRIVADSLSERQEVIAEAIRERNVLEGQKDELEKIVHSLQAKIRKLEAKGDSTTPTPSETTAQQDEDYNLIGKIQALQADLASVTAQRDNLRQQLSQADEKNSAEVERILAIAVQERDQIARTYQRKKQQEDERHKLEVERILTLSIEESDRLRADRDRLRALNETLLKKLQSANASPSTAAASSEAPVPTAAAAASPVSKDRLREELNNVTSSSKS